MNKKNKVVYLVLVLIVVVAVAILLKNMIPVQNETYNATQITKNTTNSSVTVKPSPAPIAPNINMTDISSRGIKLGSDNATVILVEFSDYQCPFCRRFWLQNFPVLKKEFVDTGKVQVVYRDFPLDFHPAAEISAESVYCAGEQNKSWELHDLIFSEQTKVSSNGIVQYTESDIKQWVKELDIDTTAFEDCLDSGKYAKAVADSHNEGIALGIRETPSFIIGKRSGTNIVPIDGALPYGTFRATIDQLLQ